MPLHISGIKLGLRELTIEQLKLNLGGEDEPLGVQNVMKTGKKKILQTPILIITLLNTRPIHIFVEVQKAPKPYGNKAIKDALGK